jgi:ATP-binding cassette subfamily F protein uup
MNHNAPICVLRDARLQLGADPLFAGASLALSRGERIALVGRNGAGKSTLMRLMAGEQDPDEGERFVQPGASVHYLSQEPDVAPYPTAGDYVRAGTDTSLTYRADAEMDEWGVNAALSLSAASGGQLRRVALARAFACDPDVLLMDEPTNHLDIEAVLALEARLKAFRGAVLLVSHDRRFLETVSTGVAWLRQGVVRSLARGYAAFDEWADGIEAEEERNLDRLATQLKAEERWMARGVTARRRRNMGRVRKLEDMRATRKKREQALAAAHAGARLEAAAGSPSGALVIEARDVSVTFQTPDGAAPIIRNLSLRVMRGDRIGVIGANGSGKTTLLRVLLGDLAPDQGSIRRSQTLVPAWLDQSRRRLEPERSLWDHLAPLGGDQIIVRGQPRHVAAYARDFLFHPGQLRQPVSALSGGERNRLTLALALASPSNLLVLDEPTNDLDMETLELLEDMLCDYDGTLIVVSHDRAFIDGVATSVLTPEGGGVWIETPGGYQDYEAQRPPPAARPAEARTRPRPEAAPPAARPSRKLSYKDARRLEEIDRLLPARQQDAARAEAELGAPGLFEQDPDRFSRLARELAETRSVIDALETEWLELEEKREAAQSGP